MVARSSILLVLLVGVARLSIIIVRFRGMKSKAARRCAYGTFGFSIT